MGKNNFQNDELTFHTARRTDIWLHAQKIHGSHVVISAAGKTASEKDVMEAAALAAYYSQARDAGKVPVDYALVKHVKKPSGAKPGFVIFTNQHTLYVTPDEALLAELLKQAVT